MLITAPQNIEADESTASNPEQLLVEGKKSPNKIKKLFPTFSATYKNEISKISAKNIEVIIEGKDIEKKWEMEQKSDVNPNETEEIQLKGSPLIPGKEYEWKVRFQNKTGWSDWKKSSFSTAKFLNLPPEEAKEFLKTATSCPEIRANVLKTSMKENSSQTIDKLKSLSVFTLNDILSELTNSINSPQTAAEILQKLPKTKSFEIVSSMIQMKNFDIDELENIISQKEISEEKLQNIYEGLPDQLQKELEEKLSEDAKNRISALSGGTNSTIAIILLVIILALTLLRYRMEKVEKKKEEKWNQILAKFLSSGKNRMVIPSNLPPKKSAGRAKSTIERLGVKDKVDLGKEEGEIYLIRKS
uniref:Uncharacterized protein n=1 Tax=uncultured organism TaxID=155900 RepID=M1PWL3_9ZZZZ|nr:hypothetical protein FLSS-10_0004 [uncultured organism]